MVDEGIVNAALHGDINSSLVALDGLYEGDKLQGVWISLNFKYIGSEFANFSLPYILWEISQRNY